MVWYFQNIFIVGLYLLHWKTISIAIHFNNKRKTFSFFNSLKITCFNDLQYIKRWKKTNAHNENKYTCNKLVHTRKNNKYNILVYSVSRLSLMYSGLFLCESVVVEENIIPHANIHMISRNRPTVICVVN
jgi:hypothetical protein